MRKVPPPPLIRPSTAIVLAPPQVILQIRPGASISTISTAPLSGSYEKSYELASGESIECRILIGERRIIDYFIEPF
jgi:hypothetical protein